MTYKIVVAMDSFKGSATSVQAENWLESGIRRVIPDAQVVKIPIADGGEGTVEALTTALDGRLFSEKVQGPLGQAVQAHFGMLSADTAVIEMAEASGIALIDPTSDDVLHASTYGVGQLVLSAIKEGAKNIYLGLGGSATNDGGVGLAQALGISFKDKQGNEIQAGAIGLKDIASIDCSQRTPLMDDVTIKILSDVTNPLTGENGSTAIYGRQKGIKEHEIEQVDAWLKHYSQQIRQTLGIDINPIPGSGAAGGLGAGLMAFFKTETYQGIDQILKLLHFEEAVRHANLVITGEGRMDAQSINGKAPIGIAKIAKKYHLPVIAVVGSREDELEKVHQAGIDLVLSVINRPMSLQEAIHSVKENIITAGETAMRCFLLNQREIEKIKK